VGCIFSLLRAGHSGAGGPHIAIDKKPHPGRKERG